MQAHLHRLLVAVALIAPATIGVRGRITDGTRKAVAFVPARWRPMLASEYDIMHVAMFDAVNSIDRPLPTLPDPASAAEKHIEGSSPPAAAGSVLASLNPQAEEIPRAPRRLTLRHSGQRCESAGIKLGEESGQNPRGAANDGADAPDSYRPKTKPASTLRRRP